MKIKCYFFYLLFVLVLFCCGSCGLLTKMKTVTNTVTITKIDTIIKVVKDTVTIEKTVPVNDTVIIENTMSRAVSFVDRVTGKLTLQLTGKIFDLPVKANVIETRENKVTDTKRKPGATPVLIAFLAGIIVICFAVLIALIKLNLKITK